MTAAITEFEGEFRFLSNFWPCRIRYDGLTFGSTEAAYQAAKTLDPEQRKKFEKLNALQSKQAGKKLKPLRPDWETAKFGVMGDLLRLKFADDHLRRELLSTGDAQLTESTWWHDTCWGICTCARCGNKGRNELGKLLMKIRDELRKAA